MMEGIRVGPNNVLRHLGSGRCIFYYFLIYIYIYRLWVYNHTTTRCHTTTEGNRVGPNDVLHCLGSGMFFLSISLSTMPCNDGGNTENWAQVRFFLINYFFFYSNLHILQANLWWHPTMEGCFGLGILIYISISLFSLPVVVVQPIMYNIDCSVMIF